MNSAERYFAAAAERGELGHAFLLEGEDAQLLKSTARRAAQRILCEKGTACGVCESCRAALSGNHPDIITVTHEKPDTLSVGEIRAQLVEDIEIRPYRTERKIYIVPDAGKMNPQAQNAILKTLEEPPVYGLIFLLADNRNRFLPTVLSRLVTLRCEEDGPAEEETGAGAERLLMLLRHLRAADAAELAHAAADLKADGMAAEEVLEMMTYLLRDLLVIKAEANAALHVPAAEDLLAGWAKTLSWPETNESWSALQEAGAKLKANGNADVTIELFLLRLRELLRKGTNSD
ncbi:MAG: hypothetical protein IJL47_04965 [Lachnospiraceae bacterium]|nr:hypothetical protein [Lachnospiraceae bacterium]